MASRSPLSSRLSLSVEVNRVSAISAADKGGVRATNFFLAPVPRRTVLAAQLLQLLIATQR